MATLDLGNVMGPQGPQGPQGETGPQGPQGPQGEQGPPADTSTLILKTEKGAANGVATLDGSSKLTASQFPDSNDVGVYSLNAGDSIPEGADLNDYRTAGTYVCPNSATSATILNKPQTNTNLGFKLIVQYNQSQNWFTQFFFVIDQVYVRYYNNTEQAYNQWKLIPAMDPPVYGSNANGYWEKLPGSIMIAWGTKSTGTIQSKSWSDITL